MPSYKDSLQQRLYALVSLVLALNCIYICIYICNSRDTCCNISDTKYRSDVEIYSAGKNYSTLKSHRTCQGNAAGECFTQSGQLIVIFFCMVILHRTMPQSSDPIVWVSFCLRDHSGAYLFGWSRGLFSGVALAVVKHRRCKRKDRGRGDYACAP